LLNSPVSDLTSSSSSSRHLQCGSASCPWRLHAGPGQRINLTIVLFSVTGSVTTDQHHVSSSVQSTAPVVCHRVAAVREAGAVYRDLTACHDSAAAATGSRYRGRVRSLMPALGQSNKPIYWSETNSLQLMFYVAANVYVIFRYEGCITQARQSRRSGGRRPLMFTHGPLSIGHFGPTKKLRDIYDLGPTMLGPKCSRFELS